jgi:teichuronic acid biosynthesis glycosyltransferase TuaG
MSSLPDLVSIITPLFNAGSFIRETLDSVINQTYQNWELLIVDDGSTDNGPAIVESLAKEDPRIKLFHNATNLGPAKTRNLAIEKASGRYIAFLDADDIWFPEKLTKQIEAMQKNGYALTYTSYQKITEGGEMLGVIAVPDQVTYKKMLQSNFIACFTGIYDAQQLGKVYMPDIMKRQDYGLWLKILKMTPFGYGLTEPLGYYRVRKNDSVSSNKAAAALYHWKIYREVEKMNVLVSLYYFLHYMVRGYLKFIK